MPISPAAVSSSAMHGAVVPIATGTAQGSASITFSNIPQTYQDLILVSNAFISGTNSGNNYYGVRLNGDNSGNYSTTFLSGNGSSAASSRGTSNNQSFASYRVTNALTFGSSNPFTTVWHILNYANTSTYKTILSRSANDNNGSGETDLNVALWLNTAAVTSIGTGTDNGNLTFNNSTFTLYGIRTVGQ